MRCRRAARHVGGLAFVALVLFAGSVAAPAPATAKDGPGGIGLRLTEAPVAARDDPRARLYIVDHLAPGTVIERRVAVSNSTATEQQVALYPSAAAIEDGVFVGAEGRTANELSRWTSVSPGTARLAAGSEVAAVVRIAVPADAAPGEQYAVVWAEARSAPDAGGVAQVSRVGIRLYLSVGSGAPPAPDFTVEALTPARSSGGRPTVTAKVRNTGGRALDVTGTLSMTNGPSGLSAGPFPAELNRTLAIGDTRDITITLDRDLPAGPWDAAVTLTSGVTERVGRATLTFPDAGKGTAVAAAPKARSFTPVVAGAGGLGAGAGLVGLRRVRRARRRSTVYRPRHAAHANPLSR